jgi:hypothetical protein
VQNVGILSSLAKILEDEYDKVEHHLHMPPIKKELFILAAISKRFDIMSCSRRGI